MSIGKRLLDTPDLNVDAVAGHALLRTEDVEERAVAAADVDDVRILPDHRKDAAMKPFLPLHHLHLALPEETADEL